MNEPGPFDRMLESSASRDKTARTILIGLGLLGVILLILVLPPVSLLSGDDSGDRTLSPSAGSARPRVAKAPEGYEALSQVITPKKPKGTEGPYKLIVSLSQTVTDGRNLGLYTSRGGKWERLATATLTQNGTAAEGEVGEIPGNVAVLRRTASAVGLSGWLPAGAQAEPQALELLGTINPVDYTPGAEGTVSGNATQIPAGAKASVVPTIRSPGQKEWDAINNILASPQLRDAHITALVQVALQQGNAGIDVDYERVAPARRPDFTAFVTVLAEKLHQANKSLSITLPSPTKQGVTWDTGAYDWEEISKAADVIKIVPEADPSAYYQRMTEVFNNYLKSKIDLKKVVLVVSRQSHEKGSDGLRALSLKEALTLASEIEVRTAVIVPNSSVLVVGKNIYQDDGATGIRWDEGAFAVSFAYPGSRGQRTVWIENALSIAFKLDFARRLGLGGVALDDVSQDPQAPNIWDPIRLFADTGNVSLVAPNGVILKPTWQSQAGALEPGAKGNVVWKAPAQAGVYDVTLVISDGVVRASRKVVVEVKPGTGATAPTPSPTPRP